MFFGGIFDHWGSYVLKQGSPLKIFKSLIKLYFCFLILYIFPFRIKKSIKGEIFVYVRENICRPLIQIQPEIGEYPENFNH